MFADLYRRPGALYWCKMYYTAEKDKFMYDKDGNLIKWNNNPVFRVERSSSFDINFYSMGFEGFSNGAIEERSWNDNNESDACFIRTVRTVAP